jgi:Holliday junction resolvase RusA-like endonuclease
VETVTTARLLFIVRGKPEPGGSKTPGVTNEGRRFVRDSNPAVKEWRRRIVDKAAEAMEGKELLTGPLRLEVAFYLKRPKGHLGTGRNSKAVKPSAPEWPITRPDTTKLLRALEDALKGVVWADDSQVVRQEATKWYALPGEPPRAVVYVEELGRHPSGSTS